MIGLVPMPKSLFRGGAEVGGLPFALWGFAHG